MLKQEYFRQLYSSSVVGNNIPIICNQEHFLLHGNSYKIRQTLHSSHTNIKPAVKGRPKGGLFVSVPEYFKNNIQDVSPNVWRLQALLIKTVGSTILLINSYFPVDSRSVNIDQSELIEVFHYIRNIISDNHFSSFVLLGDINCDFLRNTGHVRCVQDFLGEFLLLKSWDKFNVDFTHCHEVEDGSYFSTLDHFFWNEEFSLIVQDAGVVQSPDNNSDNSPIYCVVRVVISSILGGVNTVFDILRGGTRQKKKL